MNVTTLKKAAPCYACGGRGFVKTTNPWNNRTVRSTCKVCKGHKVRLR